MSPVRTTPAAKKTSLRPIGMPRQVMVRIDMRHPDALPVGVTRTDARGKRGLEARVALVDEVWRIAEAWWRDAGPGGGGQARTYYRVILEGGRPLTIFRDEAHGGWFEQPYSAGQHP